jgi:hypothetical protein
MSAIVGTTFTAGSEDLKLGLAASIDMRRVKAAAVRELAVTASRRLQRWPAASLDRRSVWRTLTLWTLVNWYRGIQGQ